jgi:hypothetical protein
LQNQTDDGIIRPPSQKEISQRQGTKSLGSHVLVFFSAEQHLFLQLKPNFFSWMREGNRLDSTHHSPPPCTFPSPMSPICIKTHSAPIYPPRWEKITVVSSVKEKDDTLGLP